jgi:hypothetical protein
VLENPLFEKLIAAEKHQPHDPNLNVQLGHIIRIFRAYEIATPSFTIRGSWDKPDLVTWRGIQFAGKRPHRRKMDPQTIE